MFVLRKGKHSSAAGFSLHREVKDGILKPQFCPFQNSDAVCGDWCPLFLVMPQQNGKEKPTGKYVIRLTCSKMDPRVVDVEE